VLVQVLDGLEARLRGQLAAHVADAAAEGEAREEAAVRLVLPLLAPGPCAFAGTIGGAG
jgi:hypothetical protein